METVLLSRKENKIFMLVETTGQAVSFVAFLIMGIFNAAVERFAGVIAGGYLLFSFGYWFALDWVFSMKDLAVHSKMFAKVPRPANFKRPKRKGVGTVLALWLSGTALIGVLSALGHFHWYIAMMAESFLLGLNSLFIRKKCWLSTYIMKNKNNCCKNCTINAWDYAFFASPLFFVPRLGAFFETVRVALIGISFFLFGLWEVLYFKYPWRFYADTNRALTCAQCGKKCDLAFR